MSVELLRHVNGLVSDFAAEYGEIDLIGRRIDCSIRSYDRLLEAFDAFGVVGGSGVRVIDDDRVLLVRYEGADGWVDPGDSRRPGESYVECATRAVRAATGIDASIEGLAQIHLLYMDDPTGRDPVPNPYISFLGAPESGAVRPGTDVVSARWAAEPPEQVLYEELTDGQLRE